MVVTSVLLVTATTASEISLGEKRLQSYSTPR
jgi:hypothetical protein